VWEKGDGKGIEEGGEVVVVVVVVVVVGLSGELGKTFGAEWLRGMRAMGLVVPGGAKVGWLGGIWTAAR